MRRLGRGAVLVGGPIGPRRRRLMRMRRFRLIRMERDVGGVGDPSLKSAMLVLSRISAVVGRLVRMARDGLATMGSAASLGAGGRRAVGRMVRMARGLVGRGNGLDGSSASMLGAGLWLGAGLYVGSKVGVACGTRGGRSTLGKKNGRVAMGRLVCDGLEGAVPLVGALI
jgi:hypothetical protein